MAPRLFRRRAAAPEALTAAALPYQPQEPLRPTGPIRLAPRPPVEWQRDAYAFFKATHLVRKGLRLHADLASKNRLYIGYWPPGSDQPIDVMEEATRRVEPDDDGNPGRPNALTAAEATQLSEVLERLKTAQGGQARIIADLDLGLNIAGDCSLVCHPLEDGPEADAAVGDPEEWSVMSVRMLRALTGRHPDGSPRYERIGPDRRWRPMPPGTYALRVWRPDPEYTWEPDSPVRGILENLNTLLVSTRMVRSQMRTRTSAGMWLFPRSATASAKSPQEQNRANDTDPVISDIEEAFLDPISDEGSAGAVAPTLMVVEDQHIELLKSGWLTFDRPMDKVAVQLRAEATQNIIEGLPLPPEMIRGLGDTNHWGCIREQAEILTRDGWRTHDQVGPGTLVLTLNHRTGMSEWQPVLAMSRYRVEDVEMLDVRHRNHHSTTTLNHRWPVSRRGGIEWTTSAELRASDRVFRAAPHASLPAEPKWADAFVELVAWFVTEGTCTTHRGKPNQVRIGQSHRANPDRVAMIRRALTELFGPAEQAMRGLGRPAWREFAEARGMTLFNLNAPARDVLAAAMDGDIRRKITSKAFVLSLTAAQLELFLRVCALGDGVTNSNGGLTIEQRDPARLDPIELAAILAGRPVRRWTAPTGGFEVKDQAHLAVHSRGTLTTVARQYRQVVRYSGLVWCPTTENSTWLARQDGTVFFTGNSWKIADSLREQYIDPDMGLICNALTSGLTRPLWREESIRPELLERVGVWFDPGALTSVANADQHSKDAYAEMLISGDRRRRDMDYDDADAPSDEEVAERLRRAQILRMRPADYLPDDAATVGIPEQGPAVDGRGAPAQQASAFTAAADAPSGAMVAVYPTAEQAQALAVDGGEPPETIHVTLAYLGKADDLDEATVEQIHEVVSLQAREWQPLAGEFGGVGRFTHDGSDDGDPIIATVDVPGLGSLRDSVCRMLVEAGVEMPGSDVCRDCGQSRAHPDHELTEFQNA